MIRGRQQVVLDRIQPGQRLNAFQGPIRAIGETVLNSKKDIKFHRTAENRAGATRYAQQHNLLLGPDEDINGDGINDVVLYKKDGTPVMINGYTFTNSEMPYRNIYNQRNPTKADKIRTGGYSGFMKNFRSNEEQLNAFVQTLPQGFAKKKKYEQRAPSTYQQMAELLRDKIRTELETLLVNTGRADDGRWFVSRFPYMKAISYLYIQLILNKFWNHADLNALKRDICAEADTPNGRLELFKSQLRKKHFKVWYDNAMTNEEFRGRIDSELDANLIGALNEWGVNNELISNLIDDSTVRNVADAKAQAAALIEQISSRIDNTKNTAVNQIFGV